MIDDLLTNTISFNQDVKRNITDPEPVENIFSDLADDESFSDAAEELIDKVSKNISFSGQHSDFFYTAAIAYPFETEPFMESRYSDGTFPVWYGSLDVETTIYETSYHAMRSVLNIEGIEYEDLIIKKRALYDVHCEAILFDITDKIEFKSEVTSNDYRHCQNIGKHIRKSGFPGLLSPSARYSGTNINVFKRDVLDRPRLTKKMTYELDIKKQRIRICSDNMEFMNINIT